MIDPRGIRRHVTKVDEPTIECGRCFITFECGHRTEMAAHFHYTVGSEMHCFQCGQEADLGIPTFLRREVTPATKAAVTRINNELRSGGRRIEKTAGRSSISAGHALNLDETGKALLREIKSKERKTEELRKREAFARLRVLREERQVMSKKVGKKESALRDARKADGEVSPAGRIRRTGKKKAELAPPTVMVDDASMATSPVVSDVTDISMAELNMAPGAFEVETTKPAKQKAAKKKSRPVPLGDIRSGSKLEMIAKLLQRPEGCTAADVLKATAWPSVSMPQQAKAAGLKLRKVKEGKIFRYHAA